MEFTFTGAVSMAATAALAVTAVMATPGRNCLVIMKDGKIYESEDTKWTT